ncbi:MAG: DNA polymerase III subunit gamma/tau [Parvibaculales bacterium]
MLADADEENNVAPEQSYKVLARKYRPTNFDDLIGQDAMVRTLSNAFETGRIAHAFMLTGVRGVGKTTTARILARALNYKSDETDQPSVALGAPGVHCDSIMDGSHVDIIEMDAASQTGIDDIREIIESVRYRPASARYKVYIIDEVHMLSKAAFNGLLKTLEEPPEHVKFVFATTEIRKVPITVLSRCQRFDLRRLNQDETVKLLERVCAAEGMALKDEGLALIARVAEGSARDALSLLDRAFAHGGQDTASLDVDELRAMLGLADRGRVFDLFDQVMQGNIADALDEFAAQYRMGADPVTVLSDLTELTHWLTRLKYVPAAMQDITVPEAQRQRGRDTADALSVRILSRAWQVLLKGHGEALQAPNPRAAAEMVLIRLAHLADMPAPEELLKQWEAAPASGGGPTPSNGPAQSAGQQSAPSQTAPSQTAPMTQAAGPSGAGPTMAMAHPVSDAAPDTVKLGSFEQLVAFAGQMRDIRLKHALESGVHLVRFEPATDERGGVIELRLADGQEDFLRDLSKKLKQWTSQQWMVSLSQESGASTLKDVALTKAEERLSLAEQDAMVKQTKQLFPGAEIVSVTDMDSGFGADDTLYDDTPDTEI